MTTSIIRCITCYDAISLSTARCAVPYTPRDQEKELNEAIKLSVDCVTVDCEDGVEINKKALPGLFHTSYS
jgi:hypothetical protein